MNSTDHNPPNTSHKPIGEVYFDDRAAHCVGEMPYNWHSAMARVRKRHRPRLDTHIDDAQAWAHWTVRYLFAPRKRRDFAGELPVVLDCARLRQDGKEDIARDIEQAQYEIDGVGM